LKIGDLLVFGYRFLHGRLVMGGLGLACKGLIFLVQLLLELKELCVMGGFKGLSIGLLLFD
jgi:hypothetical protein